MTKNHIKILIDNGHGVNTPGKRSPDGRFREYAWAREIARAIVADCKDLGYDAELLVPEEYDVCLSARCYRANCWCERLGKNNVLLVSIHVNAAGKGDRWYNATGWSAYTCKGQTRSDKLADCLYKQAGLWLPGHRLRMDYSDGDPDIESDFAILKKTACPAVLTENGFQDCEESLLFLESNEGKEAIIGIHVDGILDFISPNREYGYKDLTKHRR
jgi:N-acetylmuramoyl-L-alanine amidase